MMNPSYRIELISPLLLRPYAFNARTHSEEQIEQIAASIDEFGMAGAIVVRDGIIAKGHGTLAAICKLYAAGKLVYPPPGRSQGAEPFPVGTMPVLDASGWTDAQFRAFVIADNKLAENAGWDAALLRLEIIELKNDGFDLDKIGFSQEELDNILKGLGADGDGAGDGEKQEFTLMISSKDEAEITALRRIFHLNPKANTIKAGDLLAMLPI